MERAITVPYEDETLKLAINIPVEYKELNLENVPLWVKILRPGFIFFLNCLSAKLGKDVFTKFCGENADTVRVRKGITSHRALEVMYTYPERKQAGETSLFDDFWENILFNARSIRTRLRIVEEELEKAIRTLDKERVNVLSLGSGSARAVIETLQKLHGSPQVEAWLIDMSRRSLEYSKKLAGENGIASQMKWLRDYAQNIDKHCKKWTPDVVEMVGLLDYYPEEQAVDLIAKIHDSLNPGGCLITCNIRPNFERPFVTKGIGWPLIYRSPDELAEIIMKGGFRQEQMRLVYEPYRIHGLAIAQKAL